jgi:hypothetical protein
MDCLGRRKSLAIIPVIVSLILSAGLFAGPVDPGQVQKVTDAFLKAKTAGPGATPSNLAAQGFAAGARMAPGGLREIRGDDGTLLAYIADLEPRGFIALSANTDVAPVVAYSFQSSFLSGNDKKNPLYRMVREDLRLRAKTLAEHPELKSPEAGRLWDLYAAGQIGTSSNGTFQQWPPAGSTATGGWLQTAWEQGEPFNQFCPLDTVDGGRSYVGCAATAMAQVLNYHRQCNIMFDANDSYTMYSGMRMDADSALYDFPSFAALNGLVGSIRSAYDAGVDLNDVEAAALNFACGVAIQMDYSSEGSGAAPSDMQEALVHKFGFYATDMYGALSPASFLVLQENLVNRLPALVTLAPADGYGGHVLVCDGYNTDGEYHLNFGWGTFAPEKMTEVWYRLPSDLYPLDYVVTETMLNLQPQAPALTAEPGFLRFYGAPGGESDAQLLRLQNPVGNVPVSSITCPAGFVLGLADEFSDRLEAFRMTRPGQTVAVSVKFRPQQAGGYYGPLAIHYGDGNVRYVLLQGWAFDGGTQVAAGSVSGTWSQDQSPYFVNGDIQVPANGALAIEPGVKIFFTGPYGLTVGKNAKLTAQGTAAAPIELTAWNRDAGWGGLRFISSGSDDVLSYCSLTWAKKTAGLLPTADNGAAGVADEDSLGGAIYCYDSDPTIENCRLTNNLGDCGGAVYCEYSWPVIRNTLIANNTSAGGTVRCGGLCVNFSGTPELYHCTIVNNSPGGLFAGSWDGMAVTNTIVWGNEMYQIQTAESAPAVAFCDMQGGCPGSGNWSNDPCFFDPSQGPGIEYDGSAANWALQSHSPCLNAGKDVQDLPATDLAGAARTASGVLDLGAYENQSELPLLTISPSMTADAGFVQLNASSTIQLNLANTGQQDVTIRSASILDGVKAFSLSTPVQDRVLVPGESVPVEITFRPTREAVYKGRLDVRSTAHNGARVLVALKGVGVSGTVVAPGPVSGTWKKSASPYVVTGDLTIGRNKTLRIEPGVTVKFAGHFGLTVGYRGTLKAIGTEQDRIVFTPIDQGEGWFGIRLINSAADDVLQYCTLEYATKPRTDAGGIPNLFGGAILCYGSWDDDPGYGVACSPKIDSCLLTHNWAYMGGAIASVQGDQPVITRNTIVDNGADYYGAGIALFYTEATIANNVIARNYANVVGGGIANVESSPSIRNNTIFYNRPSALYLESVLTDYLDDVLPASITNNILWKNEIHMAEGVTPEEFEIRFNDVQGGWDGEGNIDQDPLFANANADDYHLKSQAGRWDPAGHVWVVDTETSPCIDAGDPASDFAAEPAFNGQRVNLGAYGGTEQASKSVPTVDGQ